MFICRSLFGHKLALNPIGVNPSTRWSRMLEGGSFRHPNLFGSRLRISTKADVEREIGSTGQGRRHAGTNRNSTFRPRAAAALAMLATVSDGFRGMGPVGFGLRCQRQRHTALGRGMGSGNPPGQPPPSGWRRAGLCVRREEYFAAAESGDGSPQSQAAGGQRLLALAAVATERRLCRQFMPADFPPPTRAGEAIQSVWRCPSPAYALWQGIAPPARCLHTAMSGEWILGT